MVRGVSGRDFGKLVCEALDIDYHQVTALDLRIRTDEAVTVKVTRLVKLEEGDELSQVVSHYRLVEIEDGPQERS